MENFDDDVFWSDPDVAAEVFDRRFEEGLPFLGVVGPSRFDATLHDDLPFQFAQAGTVRDFVERNLLKKGRIVVVDRDRNTLSVCNVDVPKGDQPARPQGKAPDLDSPAIGMQTRTIDLCADRIVGLQDVVGRFRLVAILPHVQTDVVDFRVGPADPAFDQALQASLAEVPPRTSIPESLFVENKPWMAIALRQGFPEGIALEFVVEQGRLHAVVTTALGELHNERLQLEPGAILPNGTRPPDALRRIHLVALSEKFAIPVSIEIPVNASAEDEMLRGSVKIDIERIYPGWQRTKLLSLRVFCGSWMVGPVAFPDIP